MIYTKCGWSFQHHRSWLDQGYRQLHFLTQCFMKTESLLFPIPLTIEPSSRSSNCSILCICLSCIVKFTPSNVHIRLQTLRSHHSQVLIICIPKSVAISNQNVTEPTEVLKSSKEIPRLKDCFTQA